MPLMSLKDLAAKKRKEFEANRKGREYASIGEVEETRVATLREEERIDREARERAAARRAGREAPPAKRQKTTQEDGDSEPLATAGGTKAPQGGEAAPAGDAPEKDPALAEGEESGKSIEEQLPPKETVFQRLRMINEPVTLFGEDDLERYKRLVKLQSTGQFDELVEQGKNDFQSELKKNLEEMAMHEEERDGKEKREREKEEVRAGKREQLKELEKGLGESETIEEDDFVLFFLQKLAIEWDLQMEARTMEEKTSPLGQQDTTVFKQTQRYLNPLFSALKRRELDYSVLLPLKTIVQCLMDREYVKANEWYVQLAIGNAAWPMGVTSVGIHERAGRERIETGKVAHILNNETQRKYIQGVKRLMSKAQYLYPTIPSKMVVG